MNNTIKLLNGNALPIYPKLDALYVETEEFIFFLENTSFFFDNRSLIYQDSRLFLSKIPISCDDNHHKFSTLGGFIEWWEDERSALYNETGDRLLIYQIVSNPFTHENIIHAVDSKGHTFKSKLEESNRNIHKTLSENQSRYNDKTENASTYSIMEVKKILQDRLGLTHAYDGYWHLHADTLTIDLDEAKRRIEILNRELREARILWKQDEILQYHQLADRREEEMIKKIDDLKQKQKALKLKVPKESRGREFHKEYGSLCREIRNVERENNDENVRESYKIWPFFSSRCRCFESIPTKEELLETIQHHEDMMRDSGIVIDGNIDLDMVDLDDIYFFSI